MADADPSPKAPRDPDELRDRLGLRLGPDPGAREAEQLAVSGVLVPIVLAPWGPLVLLTRRSDELASHPGQISYPGGRREPGETPQQAALRETLEETGLGADSIEVLGHLTDYATHNDDLVCAYVGVIDPPVPLAEPLTPQEVTERLIVPLEGLLTGQASAPAIGEPLAEPPERALGTPYPILGYEARSLDTAQAREVVHYWHLGEDTALWGISAEVTARLLADAFDWQPPSKPRRVDDPADLAP